MKHLSLSIIPLCFPLWWLSEHTVRGHSWGRRIIMALLISVTLPPPQYPMWVSGLNWLTGWCFLPWEMVYEYLSPLFQSLGPISPMEKWAHPSHPLKGGRRRRRRGSRTQCLPQKLGYSEIDSRAWILWLHVPSLDPSSSYSSHTCASSGISRTILLLK